MSMGMTMMLTEQIRAFRDARARHSTKPGTLAILISASQWDELRLCTDAHWRIQFEPRVVGGRHSFDGHLIIFAEVQAPTPVWLD